VNTPKGGPVTGPPFVFVATDADCAELHRIITPVWGETP
jgi:hypothetical protein